VEVLLVESISVLEVVQANDLVDLGLEELVVLLQEHLGLSSLRDGELSPPSLEQESFHSLVAVDGLGHVDSLGEVAGQVAVGDQGRVFGQQVEELAGLLSAEGVEADHGSVVEGVTSDAGLEHLVGHVEVLSRSELGALESEEFLLSGDEVDALDASDLADVLDHAADLGGGGGVDDGGRSHSLGDVDQRVGGQGVDEPA